MMAKKTGSGAATKTDKAGGKEQAIADQKERYLAGSKKPNSGWTFKQFGKRAANWKKMSEAGKK